MIEILIGTTLQLNAYPFVQPLRWPLIVYFIFIIIAHLTNDTTICE